MPAEAASAPPPAGKAAIWASAATEDAKPVPRGVGGDPGAALASAVGLLCQAVSQHRQIQFNYGASAGLRRFAPHAVYAAAGGRLFVTGIQLAGPSGGGIRNFAVSALSALTLLDQRFKPGPAIKITAADARRSARGSA